ncbi:unnamed protein product [Cyprideis torosa]|uniref:Uncharacterized protein n=1 Tax=Cyprideis torosa TaxID=163714 RepID=A0A7R8ZKQ5_9CRUS|nr:unnamed protein product [Cyprideis torosa]CAG0880724.1 unnamed protein product [Cyprideis torosa]
MLSWVLRGRVVPNFADPASRLQSSHHYGSLDRSIIRSQEKTVISVRPETSGAQPNSLGRSKFKKHVNDQFSSSSLDRRAVPRSRSEGERPTSAIEKPKRKAPNPRPSGYTAGNSDTESTGSSRRSYERGRGGGSSSGCSSGVERRIRQQRLATLEAGVVGAEDQSSLLDQSSTSDIHLDSQKIMPEGDDYKIVFISSSGGESSTAELNSSVEDSVNRLHPPAGGSSGEGSFMEEREWEAFDSERRFRKHFPAPSTGRVKNSIFHQREHYFSDLTAEVLACSPKITRRPTAHDKDSHRLRDGLSLSPHRGGGDAHSLGSSGASLGSPRRSLSDADIHDLCERVSSEELDTGSSAGSTSSRSPEAEIEATSENGTRIIIRKKESGIRSGKPRSISPHPLDTKRHSPPGQAYDYCTSPMDQNQHGMPAEPTKPYYEVRNASTQLEADECVKIHINSKTSSKSQGYPSMGSSPTSSSELGSARGERPEPTGASTDSDSSTHDDDLKRQMVEMGVQTEDVASSSSSSAPIEDLDDSYSSIPPMKPVRLNPCNGRKRSEAYTENYSVSDDALSLPPSTISEFDSPPRDIPSGFDDASSMRPSSSRSSRSSLSSASSVREVSKEPSPDVPQLPVTPQSVSVQLDPMAVQRSSRESSVSSIHNMSSEDDTSLSTQMAVLDDDVFSDFHTNTADEAELGDEAADGHPSWLKLSDEDWKMFKYQERLAALQDDEGTSDGRLSDDDDFPLRKRHDDIPLAYDSETDDGILDGAATTGETRDGPGAETLERDQPRRKVRPGEPTSKPLAMERRLRPSPERRTKAAAGVLKESKSAAFDDELSAGSSARKRSGGILRESPPRKSPPQTPTRSKIPVPVKALGKEEAYLNRSRPDLTLNDIANEVLFDVGVSSSVSASSDVESDSEAGFFHPTSESDFDDPALTPTPGMTREGGVQLVTPTKGVTVIQIDANGKKKITEPQTVTTLRVGESPSSSEIEEESSEEERRRHESVTSELEALIAKTRRARLEFEAQQAAGVRLARRGPVNLPTVVPVAQQRHRRDDVMIEEDVLPEDEAGSFSSYDQFDGERNPYYVEEHPSDGSWTEDEQYSDVYESQSSGDEMYFDREEDLRGYNRTIDFTLHTIMEESCEESETASMKLRTPTPASSLTRRDSDISRGDANPDLEKYLVAGSDKASSPPTESIMSETSFFSEGNEDVSPEDLASTRLEKYFRSAFPVGPDGFVRPQDDVSDGSSVGEGGSNSVGSESDGQPSPERKRKKVMKSRNRRGSVENLLNRSSRSEGIYSDVSGAHSADEAGELSEFSCNGELRSSSSGRILSSEEEEITAFDKSDGQFDTIKRRKKKRPESASDSERKEKEFDLKRTSEAEDEYKVATVTMQLQHSSRKNRDSGFLGSSDDLLKSSISNEESGKRSMDPSTVSATPGEPQADSGKSSPADNADGDDPDGEKRAADCESSPSQGHKQVVRKDSFYNWSSDEETNLMMNRMRAFFKNLVSGTGKVGEQRVKPPRLLEFEEKLTNLMKTVPGIKDEQVKEIVEYLSSEDTWSDSYDSSDYTSSDLEGALQHQFDLQAVQGNPVLQEQISASCKEIIQKFESSNTKEQSDGDRDSPHSLSKETAFVYHRLVTSINKMTSESADTKSPAPQSSPPLIAKVMQHIGTRLVALMHEVSAPESHSSSRTPQLLSAKMLRPGIAQNRILEASDEDDTPKASPSSTLKTPLSSNTTPRASPYSTLKPEVPASAKSALELGREALLGEGITLNPTEQPEQGAGARKRLFPLEQRKHHLSLEKIFDANGQPTADGRWNKSASCDNLIDKPSPSGEGVDQTPSPSSYRPSWMEDRKPVSRLEKPLSWLTKGKRMKTKSNERLCAPITPPYRPSAPGFPSATRLQSTGTPENDDYSNKASVYGFMASGANRSTRSLEGFALRRRSEEIAASARSIDDRRKLSAAPQTPPPASTPSSGSGSPNVSARFRPSPERGVVGSTRSQSTSTSKAAFNKRAAGGHSRISESAVQQDFQVQELVTSVAEEKESLKYAANGYGATKVALHYATRCRYLPIVKYLLKIHPTLALIKNIDGVTALTLHQAAHWALADPLFIILQAGEAQIDSEDERKRTPILVAIGWDSCSSEEADRFVCVKLLLEFGANVHHQDDEGNNPLHYASRMGYLSIVRKLLMMVDPYLLEMKNKDGLTPLDISVTKELNEYLEKVKTLLQKDDSLLRAVFSEDMNHLVPGFICQFARNNVEDMDSRIPYDLTENLYLKSILCPHNHPDHKYKRINHLGSGSFGNVDRVVHKSTEKEFAKKLVSPGVEGDLIREQREINALKAMRHPNVVQLEVFWMETRYLVIVMELCSGSLDKWLLDHEVRDIEDIHKLFVDISLGISYIHGKGLIHRDLKPNNIFVNVTPLTAKVADLGLAVQTRNRIASTHTASTGNRYYRAPEQQPMESWTKIAKYTSKVDVYAMALIWTEILIPIFNDAEKLDYFALVKGQFFRARPIRQFVDRYFLEFQMIEKMIEENYKNRPSSAEVRDAAERWSNCHPRRDRRDALSEELRSLTPPLKGRGGSGNALGIPHSNSSSAFPISGDETDDPERFTPKLYAPPNRISISPARSVASASSTEATPSSSLATTPSSSILNLASAPSQIPVRGEVELSLQYNTQGKSLDVFVRACRDLAAVDTRRHRSDPYVKAYLLPDRTKTGKRKTKVRKHTLNPVFEEILRFPGTLEDLKSRTLWVSVWHQDMFGRNDFLGEISLPLAGQDLADPSNKWFPLKERQFLAHMEEIAPQVSSAGRLLVALQYQPRSAVVHVNEMKKELGKLCVLVKEGRDLGTSGHPMDSFVKCCLLPEKSNKQKSSTVKRTRNPVWNHSFIFEGISLLDLADRALEISVWEADRLSSSLIGTLRCSLGSGLHNGKSVDWMDATGEERDLWQRMIDRPRFWVQECLTLKTSSDRS